MKYWMNVYRDEDGGVSIGRIKLYERKSEAESMAKNYDGTYPSHFIMTMEVEV